MNERTLRLGLIGKDVSKSDSEKMHRFILSELGINLEYKRFSVTPDEFDNAMRSLMGDFDGFNVTIPYKRDVFAYLDGIEGDAFSFGAVNTVITSTRLGYNTDGIGFMLMLRGAGIDVVGKKILVLGAGGSGRSTAAVLKQAGANVFLYQRRKDKLLEICAELGVTAAENVSQGGFDILVNCTGVGMHDTEGVSPVEDTAFQGASVAVDLIYVPRESQFLKQARALGLQTVNGEAMLFYQAYYADCLYLEMQPIENQALSFFKKYVEENS